MKHPRQLVLDGLAPYAQAIGDLASPVSVIFSQRDDGRQPRIWAAVGAEAAAQRDYEAYFGSRNVWLLPARRFQTPESIRTNQMLCSDADLLRSEYYNDFLRPNDIRYALSMTLRSSEGSGVHLTFHRRHGQRAFDRVDVQKLRLLVPHLQQAGDVHRQFSEISAQCMLLEQLVHRVGRGAAAVDRQGRIV